MDAYSVFLYRYIHEACEYLALLFSIIANHLLADEDVRLQLVQQLGGWHGSGVPDVPNIFH